VTCPTTARGAFPNVRAIFEIKPDKELRQGQPSLTSLAIMKFRRMLLVACAGIALVVVAALAVSAYWEHRQIPFQNAPKLITALQAFSRDQTAGGRQLPLEVSLQDLLRGGYLTTNDMRAFADMEVTFSTQADDTHPQMILARARTTDGHFICLLADGSVQQFTASRLKEALKNSSQPDGLADRNQTVRAETNQASAPAASGRGPVR